MKHLVRITMALSFSFIFIILAFTFNRKGMTIKNPNINKTTTTINEIVPYGIDYIYDDSMPEDADSIIVEEGVNGLSYTYDGLEYITLSEVSNQIVKKGTGKKGNYTGTLTGYGPDCPGCSLVGNVSCITKAGTRHSLKNDGIYYKDESYGDVRILAADNSLFPCGTVIKVSNKSGDFLGVVLDSGATMRKAWANGTVWIDLAFSTESDASKAGVTNKNTSFEVQRWGW
ncbi:MAG: hypothetical protein Q4E75_03240 [bacterium]|nr:hypothetical protein [bacterium]